MERNVNLGMITWAAAGIRNVPLEPIPDEYANDNYSVASINLDFRFDITTGAGGGCTTQEMMEWVQNIFLKASDHVFVNGINAWQLQTCLGGISKGGVTDIGSVSGIGASQANDISHLHLHIQLQKQRALNGNDFICPAAMFNDATLQLNLGIAALNANSTINACVVKIWAEIDRVGECAMPALPTMQAIQAPLFGRLPSGIYTELLLENPLGGNPWAAADITIVSLMAAGEYIHSAVEPDALLLAFERNADRATLVGASDWQDCAASLMYLPLIWPGYNDGTNKLRGLVDTKGGHLILDCKGTLSAPIYIMRYYTALKTEDAHKILTKMGVANPGDTTMKRKTVSKQPITIAEVSAAPGLRAGPVKVVGTKSGSVLSLGKQAQKVAPAIGRIAAFRRPAGISR